MPIRARKSTFTPRNDCFTSTTKRTSFIGSSGRTTRDLRESPLSLYSRIARGKLNRLVSIVRYHKSQQLIRRALSRIQQKILVATKGGKYSAPPSEPLNLTLAPFESDKFLTRYAAETLSPPSDFPRHGVVRLINETQRVGYPIDWRCDGLEVTHLWRFHLHYHEFLLGLVFDVAGAPTPQKIDVPSLYDRESVPESKGCATIAPTTNESITIVWDTIHDWIKWNPLSQPAVHGDAWHPFCISRRLRVWYLLLQEYQSTLPQSSSLMESIWQQTNFLNDHLERDLGGNHLLENLRALAWSAAYLRCSDQKTWRATVAKYVPRELALQILPSGEHFERSPHYHIEMLDAVCDLADTTKAWNDTVSSLCRNAARSMAKFLPHVLHTDGSPALFSDGAHESADRVALLCRRAESLEVAADLNQHAPAVPGAAAAAAPCGNYWKYQSGDDCLIFDAGPIGPDHLPAHGHSDLHNFEASIAGKRFIVDTGTIQYGEGTKRDYVRSTAAHNCLEVDGLNQCDVWSRFRLGHRGNSRLVDSGRSGEIFWAKAQHDAYRDLGISAVHRLMVCAPEEWLVFDWFQSGRSHELKTSLHFGPDVAIDKQDANVFFSEISGQPIRVQSLNTEKLELIEAEFYPDFGITQQITKAVGGSRQSKACWLGWTICLKESNSNCNVRFNQRDGFRISYSNGRHKLEWK